MKEEIKAGSLIFASLIILSIVIILIGGGKFLEKVDRYYINVSNAAGLEVGAQVRLGGVRVGRVLNIVEPDEPGEPVLIEIGIKKGTRLYRGSKALITQIGFVGDIYLLLTIDNTISERIMPGNTIPSEESVGFAVLMSRLDGLSNSLDELIKDLRKLFSQKNIDGIEKLLGNTNDAIISVSSNIEKISAGLKNTTDKLGTVLNEIEGLVSDNRDDISQLIKKAKEDLEHAGVMIRSIDKTARSIDRAVDINNQNLDSLLNAMTSTIMDLQEVIQEIKNKPWSIIYTEERSE